MNPEYPVYVVSKGRADKCLTAKCFQKLKVPFHIVVNADEYSTYSKVFGKDMILPMPQRYYDEYDTFDDLGDTKAKGPGAARNYCWDHSIELGYDRHWVFDDNIRVFYRLNNNLQIHISDGTIFKIMEDFVNRYENVAIAGPQYKMFVPRKTKHPPFIINTRVYSMLLILNSIPYRWRGRYNEDTDLSLRALKDGWCTVQFYAFMGDKLATQMMSGGNTDQFYSKEGTLPKSKMQVAMHPDVSKLVWKFNRWHHHIDYRPFKKNRLIRKDGITLKDEPNNYGMVLKKINDDKNSLRG